MKTTNELLDYYYKHRSEIEGWNSDTTLKVMECLMKNSSGNTTEIGLHHGQSFMLLAILSNGTSYGIDIFDEQHLNLSNSGKGSLVIVNNNLRKFCPELDVSLVQADSTRIKYNDKNLAFGSNKFVSIDGDHTRAATFSDLLLAEALLHDNGVVAVDDIYRVDWPGVTAGVHQYMSLHSDERELHPFALSPNKAYFAKSEAGALNYQRILCEEFPDRYKEDMEFFNTEVLYII